MSVCLMIIKKYMVTHISKFLKNPQYSLKTSKKEDKQKILGDYTCIHRTKGFDMLGTVTA